MKIAYHATYNAILLGITHQKWFIFSSPIDIWQKEDGNIIRAVHEIIGTTFHELTHFSYNYRVSEYDYNNTQEIIKESWASFAQWLLMTDLYPDYSSQIYKEYSKSY